MTCYPFKSTFGLPTPSSHFPPAHHLPRVPLCQPGGRLQSIEDEQGQMQDTGVVRRMQLGHPIPPNIQGQPGDPKCCVRPQLPSLLPSHLSTSALPLSLKSTQLL